MTGAQFVACPKCSRLMLGQRDRNGNVYPQPHACATPPAECPNAELHETFAGMECGQCGTVIPPAEKGEADA